MRGCAARRRLARAGGGSVRAIHVLDSLTYGTPAMMGGPDSVALRKELEKDLRSELDRAIAALPGDVSVEPVLVAGDPPHELAVQSSTLDLLLTGSRGYGPLRAVLAGGVTGRLLRHAACPVIVLPRGVESSLATLFAPRAAARA